MEEEMHLHLLHLLECQDLHQLDLLLYKMIIVMDLHLHLLQDHLLVYLELVEVVLLHLEQDHLLDQM